jgi:hypothetical protein
MRYGMLLAGDLATGVAAAYGIDRAARQVVVSVTVLRQRPAALPLPVHARVTGTWRGLIGESRPLEFRSVLEGPAVSYVAVAPVRSHEAMIFEIAALPGGTNVPLAARVTREFDADPRGP